MQIVRLVAGRILLSLLTLLIVSLIIFAVLEILPGDVATRILGRDATPEALELLRAKLGLNDPAPLRYLHWLGGLLTGDLGQSLASSRPVGEIVAPRIYNTVLLSAYAFLLYLPLTVLPALLQAIRRDRPVDHAFSILTLVLLSVPDFLLATILLFTFVVLVPILPAISLVDHSSSATDCGNESAPASAPDTSMPASPYSDEAAGDSGECRSALAAIVRYATRNRSLRFPGSG